MKLTVDRIVQGIAVIEKEDMSHFEVSLSDLPHGTKEGTVLEYDGENYVIDPDEEEERKRRISQKQKLLFKKGKKD